jgi:hypothetical protein
MTSQLLGNKTKKVYEENPGTNPILFLYKSLCLIIYLQGMQLVRDCTVHAAVGHSWLADLQY